MAKISSVSEKGNIWCSGAVKTSILAFDRIYIPPHQLHPDLLMVDLAGSSYSVEDVEYLIELGIVCFNPAPEAELINSAMNELRKLSFNSSSFDDIGSQKRKAFASILERMGAQYISDNSREIAIPFSSAFDFLMPVKTLSSQQLVYSLVLESFPIIHEDVSFDELLDFKSSNRHLYSELVMWTVKAAKSDSDPIALTAEIESLISKFKAFEKASELKYKPGLIELTCVGADIFKKAFSLNFDGVTKSLASIRRDKANLLEAEFNNPGRPLGFIAKAQEVFS